MRVTTTQVVQTYGDAPEMKAARCALHILICTQLGACARTTGSTCGDAGIGAIAGAAIGAGIGGAVGGWDGAAIGAGAGGALGVESAARRHYGDHVTQALQMGDHDTLNMLALEMASSGIFSIVKVNTVVPGASIKYRLIALDDEYVMGRLTNDVESRLAIGVYYIWAERNGEATSLRDNRFMVVDVSEEFVIEEVVR